ncbi:N-acetylmuramate alpha-1-phosphate uridylyltransferase MurU [Ketobacter alkanivorans]|uniref:Mannose-1-phosphate guanylyltransferase n=1 Tax=Ketobacter alkanivorans TaxID=1917421 RepID=A0A2K9LQP1_9GAMM|nr:nucleotidyltransferase family protein [Ketobacter alkanivorans]AUM13795.1 mannose-1-phosphate guanylyltransferase [Ketobacter alkanivorans]
MKAMLLAAGRGERMGALTARCPKPLLSVAGKPLLRHHLERMSQAGIREVVVNVSYLADQIDQYLQQQTDLPLSIQVSREAERLETGGGIHNALPLLGEAPFLLINSDVWSDYPLQQLPAKPDGMAHLILVSNPPHNPNGDFGLDGGKVMAQGEPRYTFSGISVLSPELFKGCEPGCFPLAPLLRQAMEQGTVHGEHYSGCWVDVGTPQRLQVVEQILQEQRQ